MPSGVSETRTTRRQSTPKDPRSESSRKDRKKKPSSAPRSRERHLPESDEEVEEMEEELPAPLPALKEAAETPEKAGTSLQGTPTIVEPSPQPPLFNDEQLRRFGELYSQAPMLYPRQSTAPPGTQHGRSVQRPLFLEQEEQRLYEDRLTRSQYPYPYIQENRMREEQEEMRRMMTRIVDENERLRRTVHELQTRREEDPRFATPEDEVNDHVRSFETRRYSEAKEAARPPEARRPKELQEAGRPPEAEGLKEPWNNPEGKEAVRPPVRRTSPDHGRTSKVRNLSEENGTSGRMWMTREAARPLIHQRDEDLESGRNPEPLGPHTSYRRVSPPPDWMYVEREDWRQPPRGSKEEEEVFWSGEGGAEQRLPSPQRKKKEKDNNTEAMEVMLKILQGMQAMQKQFLDDREEDKGERSAEVVRGGQQTLPSLPEWQATTGPIDLNDWLALIEPIMSDLTASSSQWWSQLMEEAGRWYQRHMALTPLDRVNHDPNPSSLLNQPRWTRLERRASTMLVMALPDVQREELISTKRLSALKIICHLLKTYQPGGLAEKELILRSLESPVEVSSLSEAVQALRRWSRWRRRAGELGVLEPDPFILLKGLNRLIKKPLENNRDLSFRINLARSTLQVDSTPTAASVTSFAMHLLAEFEQVAHQENIPAKKKQEEKTRAAKLAKAEAEEAREGREGKGGSKGKDKEDDSEKPKCKFYLTEAGCKRGKSCRWSHDQRDGVRRCWNCGSSEHMATTCPRSKGGTSTDTSPNRPRAQKLEAEEQKSDVKTKEEKGEKEESTMKDLLAQANTMLRSIAAGSGATGSGSSQSEDEKKEDVMEKLQQQLNSLRQKAFKLNRLVQNDTKGLIDSGATNPLRSMRDGEDCSGYRRVNVSLAHGGTVRLLMNEAGVMVTSDPIPLSPSFPWVSWSRC